MAKKTSLKDLKKKRDLAVQFRKDTWDDDARAGVNFYLYGTHEALEDIVRSRDSRHDRKANYVFSTIEGIIPKMFDRVPGFTVLPRGNDDVEKAPRLELIMKYKFDRVLDFETAAKDASRDMLTTGLGYFKLTWGFKEGEKKDEDDVADVFEDDLRLEVIDPFDVFITAGDKKIQEAEGVFQQMFLTEDEAKLKWPKAKELKAEHFIGTFDEQKKDQFGKTAKRVHIWEYHGRVKNKETVIVFTDKEILNEREPYEHGRRPLIDIADYRLSREYYARGEVFNLAPLQEELHEIDLQLSAHRKRLMNPKKFVLKDAVDNVNMTRLKDPRANIVEMNNINDIRWEPTAPISNDAYNIRQIKKEDIGLMSGINEQSRGGAEKVVKTATGQSILSDATAGRIRDKVRTVSKAFEELLQQAQGLLAQFQDAEGQVKITDTEGDVFAKFTKEDIKGGFDFEIDIVESMPFLRDKRAQSALALFQEFKGDPDVDQIGLKKKVMKLAFQDVNADELVVVPEPVEETPVEAPEPIPQEGAFPPELPQLPPQGIPQEAPPGIPAF